MDEPRNIELKEKEKKKLSKLEGLPTELLILIALDFSSPVLLSYCVLSKIINEKVCQNPDFWLEKLRNDFDFDITINKSKAKEYYKFFNEYKYKYKNAFFKDAIEGKKLIEASKLGYLRIVKYLVSKGTNIHPYMHEALTHASGNGHLDVVKYLVSKGANIHAYDGTALGLASQNGHLEVVKYLVSEGAKIHRFNVEGLIAAAERGHLEVVKYLVEKGLIFMDLMMKSSK